MAKTLPASSGYFNKKMLDILEGDTKKPAEKKSTQKKPAKKGR